MKTRIVLILLFITSSLYSQISGEVEYYGVWYGGRLIQGYGSLMFNGSTAMVSSKSSYDYLTKSIDTSFTKEIATETGFGIVETHKIIKEGSCKFGTNDPFNLFYDLNEGLMYQIIKSEGQKAFINYTDTIFLISEELGNISWEIIDEQKQIGDFMCQKAYGRYKGRDYAVWFAPDIPISLGPWKLNGLPGIILEAEDSQKEVWFYAKKVRIEMGVRAVITKPNVDIVGVDVYNRLCEERLEQVQQDLRQKTKKSQSRLPKGSSIKMTLSVKKSGLELE